MDTQGLGFRVSLLSCTGGCRRGGRACGGAESCGRGTHRRRRAVAVGRRGAGEGAEMLTSGCGGCTVYNAHCAHIA